MIFDRDVPVSRQSLLSSLPPEWPHDLFPLIQGEVSRSRRRIVVLDDDPTAPISIAPGVAGFPEGALGDRHWQASINGVHWTPVRVNPGRALPNPNAADLDSIWYYEDWNPIYSGIILGAFGWALNNNALTTCRR